MNEITLTVISKPIGKARARTVYRGGYIHSYTPKPTVDYEKLIRKEFAIKYPNHKLIENKPIVVEIIASFDLPSSYPKKIKDMLKEKSILPNLKKPDWDNIAKTVCDALNGLVWKDDALIVSGSVSKVYYSLGAQLSIIIKWSD